MHWGGLSPEISRENLRLMCRRWGFLQVLVPGVIERLLFVILTSSVEMFMIVTTIRE